MSLALLAARRAASTSVRAFSSSAGSTGTPTYTGSVYKESESARENLFFSKARNRERRENGRTAACVLRLEAAPAPVASPRRVCRRPALLRRRVGC